MKAINFKSGDPQFQAVLIAFCQANQYAQVIDNPDFDPEKEPSPENPETIANPESMEDFIYRKVVEYIHEPYKNFEVRKAERVARDSKRDELKDVEVTEMAAAVIK